MNKNNKKLLFILTAVFFISFALPSNAAILPYCAYSGDCEVCDFFRLFINLANWGYLYIGSAALLFFIIGGMFLVTGGSKPDRLNKGKQIVTSSIVGMIIVLCSWLIINFVITSLANDGELKNSISKGSWYELPTCKKTISASLAQKGSQCLTYADNLPKSRKSYDEKNCSSLLTEVTAGASCTPCLDGGGGSQNCVLVNIDSRFSCHSLCWAEDFKDDNVDQKCKKRELCNNENETIIESKCPGGKDDICCSKPAEKN